MNQWNFFLNELHYATIFRKFFFLWAQSKFLEKTFRSMTSILFEVFILVGLNIVLGRAGIEDNEYRRINWLGYLRAIEDGWIMSCSREEWKDWNGLKSSSSVLPLTSELSLLIGNQGGDSRGSRSLKHGQGNLTRMRVGFSKES